MTPNSSRTLHGWVPCSYLVTHFVREDIKVSPSAHGKAEEGKFVIATIRTKVYCFSSCGAQQICALRRSSPVGSVLF